MPLLHKFVPVSADELDVRLAQQGQAIEAASVALDAAALAEADGEADPAMVDKARKTLADAVDQRERTGTALRAVRVREAITARAKERTALAARWSLVFAAAERRAKHAATFQASMEAAAAAHKAMIEETTNLAQALPLRPTESAVHAQHAFIIGGLILSSHKGTEFHRVGLVIDPVLAGGRVPTIGARYADTLGALKHSRDESMAYFDARTVSDE